MISSSEAVLAIRRGFQKFAIELNSKTFPFRTMYHFKFLLIITAIVVILFLSVNFIFTNDIDTGSPTTDVDTNDAGNKPEVKYERFNKTKEQVWIEITANGTLDTKDPLAMVPTTGEMYTDCYYMPLAYFHTNRPKEERYEGHVKELLTVETKDIRTELARQGTAILTDFKRKRHEESFNHADFFYKRCTAFQKMVDEKLAELLKLVEGIEPLPLPPPEENVDKKLDENEINDMLHKILGGKGVTKSDTTENAGDNANAETEPVTLDEKENKVKVKEDPLDPKNEHTSARPNEKEAVKDESQPENESELVKQAKEKLAQAHDALKEKLKDFGVDLVPSDPKKETETKEKSAASKSVQKNEPGTNADTDEDASVNDLKTKKPKAQSKEGKEEL